MKKPVTVDGVKYFVAKPTSKQEAIAKLESNKTFRKCLDAKDYFRAELNAKLIESGVWSEKEEAELVDYQKKIKDNLTKLEEGGIELEEAKALAIETRKCRIAQILLSHKLREHDARTIEGQCDNVYFDTLVSLCSYTESGELLFKDLNDYLDKAEEPHANACAKELSSIIFGLDDNWEKELPENKFLIEYKFVDEDLNYINKDGKRIDLDGRLIDESGRFIDSEGNFIDKDGNKVDESGKKVKEKKPFLVNGTPV